MDALSRRRAIAGVLVALLVLQPTTAQLSRPVVTSEDVDQQWNKFLQRSATLDASGLYDFSEDDVIEKSCRFDLHVKWHTELHVPVHGTPVITDLFSDGRKDILVPGFRQEVAVVDARTGEKEPELETFHESALSGSPVLFDVDGDGTLDILVATHSGEVISYTDAGERASPKIFLPGLRVDRKWHEGLGEDYIDHSHPDVGDGGDRGVDPAEVSAGAGRRLLQWDGPREGGDSNDQSGSEGSTGRAVDPSLRRSAYRGATASSIGRQERPHDEAFVRQQAERGGLGVDDEPGSHAHDAHADAALDAALDRDDDLDAARWADDSGVGRWHLHDDGHEPLPVGREEAPDHDTWWDDLDWDDTWGTYRAPGEDGDGDRGGSGGGDDGTGGRRADQEDPTGLPAPTVLLDAHVTTTPAVGDVDGDGNDELVLAVTYYLDPATYSPGGPGAASLHPSIRLSDYLAAGVVALDPRTHRVKWSTHLDLSTGTAPFKANARASPVLADVDGDGRLEVIVGGGMGFLYVLDGRTGQAREGWPIQMGAISSPVAAGDLLADGRLILVAGDERGSVAAFVAETGEEIWETHLRSAVSPGGTTLADVDGDGLLEVLVGTASGALHVLSGADGSAKPNFPFQAGGALESRPQAARLARGAPQRGDPLAILIPAADGTLYVVDGASGCADAVDLGGRVLARPLLEDLDGDGLADVLVATEPGGLFALGTHAGFSPLAADANLVPGRTGSLVRVGWRGVEVGPGARRPRDVRGETLRVPFSIVDEPARSYYRRLNLASIAALSKGGAGAAGTARVGTGNLGGAPRFGGSSGGASRSGGGAGVAGATATEAAAARDAIKRHLRASLLEAGGRNPASGAPYRVTVLLQNVGAGDMGAGDEPVIGLEHTLNQSGSFALEIPTPRTRTAAVVRVELTDRWGLVHIDEFAVSFHMHFYRPLKWIVALPFLAAAAAVIASLGPQAGGGGAGLLG